ncbi:MAG: transposase [Chloroflexi bacterium]|nr:transposase [Chloroflexota bacterium]
MLELTGIEVTVAAAEYTPTPPPPQPVRTNHAYAILWRAREPLPDFLHIPLRRALERIAKANACMLTHFDVTEQYVHLVVNCPPGRNGTWAAHLFKNGSERELQTQFQVRTTFWTTGHYATESPDPLPHAELDLFMQIP